MLADKLIYREARIGGLDLTDLGLRLKASRFGLNITPLVWSTRIACSSSRGLGYKPLRTLLATEFVMVTPSFVIDEQD